MNARFQYRLEKNEYLIGAKVLAKVLTLDHRITLLEIALMCLAVGIPSYLSRGSFSAVLLAIALYGLVFMLWQNRLRAATFDPATADVEVIFNAESVNAQYKSADRRWSWDAVRRVHDLPEAVIVEFHGYDHLTLPNRLWAELEQRSAFLRQIRERAPNLISGFSTAAFGTASRAGLFPLASLSAAVNAFWVLGGLLVLLLRGGVVRPFAPNIAVAALVIVAVIAAQLTAAYFVGRLTNAGLQRLSAHRPHRATAVAYLLIVIFWIFLIAMWFWFPPLRN